MEGFLLFIVLIVLSLVLFNKHLAMAVSGIERWLTRLVDTLIDKSIARHLTPERLALILTCNAHDYQFITRIVLKRSHAGHLTAGEIQRYVTILKAAKGYTAQRYRK